ncbi:2-oxoacid:acceptor oxidoreductase family protein, partial [Candidatus Bathyarchaeota archaeon]|nr:2-oxoacid:acceptor oxidoreductase family protein [Candidatus Bathyarchaeota archaeon]
QNNGHLFLNSSLVTNETRREDIQVVRIPANDVALEVGEKRAANMVMLGAYVEQTKVVTKSLIFEGLKEFFGKKMEFLDVNKRAFEAGMRCVQDGS